MGLRCLEEWKRCGGAGSKLGRVFGGGRKTSRTNKHSSASSSSRKQQQAEAVTTSTTSSSSSRIPNLPSSSSMALMMGTRGELEEVFRKFDRDGDGRISSAEVAEVLSSLGAPASEEEVRAMMAHADLNGDGFIDVAEFVAVNSAQPQPQPPPSSSTSSTRKRGMTEGEGEGEGEVEEVMRSAFRIFDANGDGVITAEELQRVMACIGEPCSVDECRAMIGRVDMDGDGRVSFHEFQRMMTCPPIA